MFVDRPLLVRVVRQVVATVESTPVRTVPFPHAFFEGIFPEDVYRSALAAWPDKEAFSGASRRHHTDEYGGSTRSRLNLVEKSLAGLPAGSRRLWTTLRAAIGSPDVKRAVFDKLACGLARRFGTPPADAAATPAFPRDTLYSEKQGYRIAPHPDTREKIVTMQFAFPPDGRMKHIGTEFYSRSGNPLHWLREPRGFLVRETMPFLPNCAYAFSVLNTIGLKSWHGRSKIDAIDGVRNSLLHIWYAQPDETHAELEGYLADAEPLRRAA
jgi:hypothetical protein